MEFCKATRILKYCSEMLNRKLVPQQSLTDVKKNQCNNDETEQCKHLSAKPRFANFILSDTF